MNPGRPGARLMPALAACAGLALAAPWWPAAAALAGGGALALLALAAAEGWWLGRHAPRAERAPRAALSQGRPALLACTVLHPADAPLTVGLRQTLPPLLGGGEALAACLAPPGRGQPCTLAVLPQHRGEDRLPALAATWTRFGLWERSGAIAPAAAVDVVGDLEAVRRLRRRLDALFLRGLGQRIAPRRGQGREFDRLRDYVPGDDYRHLEWKASARRGRLTIKEWRVERSQDVLLCLDRGHRMRARVDGAGGPLERLDHAVSAAVLAAWLAHRSEDRVGLVGFADGVDPGLAPGRGPAHLAALTALASRAVSEAVTSDYRALALDLRRRLRHRTLVMILTALPEHGDEADLLAAVSSLAPRHLPLVLVLRDPHLQAIADHAPGDRAALCRTLVAGDLVDGRQTLMRALQRRGALVAECDPGDAGEAAVNAYLMVKRRQLL